MNDTVQSRVASLLSVAAGGWLLISPLFISISGPELVNTYIVGGIIAAAALIQLLWENTLPSWVNALAAAWLAISTLVFSMSGAALWSALIAAAVAFVLAVWDGIEVDQVMQKHVHAH